MSWYYNGVVFEDRMIPFGAVGFIYHMSAVIDGKSVAYIGKKNFFFTRKKKLKKNDIPKDRRKKNYEVIQKPNFQNYFSSNEVLKNAYERNIKIKREILKICYSKGELTYEEVKHQFQYGVLENDLYLNANILGCFFKRKNKT